MLKRSTNFTEAAQRYEEAIARAKEAKLEMYEALIDTVSERPKFAYEIGEEAGMSGTAIASMINRIDFPFGRISRRRDTVKKKYARILPDGTVDMDDVVTHQYRAYIYKNWDK